MERTSSNYQAYLGVLKRELVPAMGCTEPIAIAYCAAKAKSVLGVEPDRVLVAASGNIIKNVKSVIVPNTNGRKGIAVAAAIGIVAGDESRGLEVIASSGTDTEERLAAFLASTEIKTEAAESDYPLDIMVTLWRGDSSACVRIVREHTNIVMIRRNENVLFEKKTVKPCTKDGTSDNSFMSMEEIYDFADTADLSDVRELIGRQIRYNSAIAEEGLRGDYGANIGRILLRGDSSVRTRAKALAAAGSDARMNGCSLPVVINSGSGNQGLTASLPVIAYAQEWGSSEEKLYRALLLSNLITLHEKAGIGRLSAYCGAVSAGAGACAGIAYLLGGDYQAVIHTVVNALAVSSGIVCDGAKSSCAGKIALAVEAGLMGYEMYLNGRQFYGGDGIIRKGVENTLQNISRLGRVGMRETDREIIRMMVEEP